MIRKYGMVLVCSDAVGRLKDEFKEFIDKQHNVWMSEPSAEDWEFRLEFMSSFSDSLEAL